MRHDPLLGPKPSKLWLSLGSTARRMSLRCRFALIVLASACLYKCATAQPVVCSGASEGYTMYLSCPAGTTIQSIDFASYGVPTDYGGCNYGYEWCNSGSSFGVVRSYCLGTGSCAVPAVNGVFGDPCVGTYKRLYVRATCTSPCNPPSTANSYYEQLSSTTWRWYCNGGYYGATLDRVCQPDGSFSGSPISCTPCPVGSYCPGAGTSILPCQAGYYGGAQALSSPSCSGCCSAGYYCTSGSSSATQNRCGGVGQLYCPACSSGPTTVSPTWRTTPTAGALDLRTGQESCPSGYTCTNGLTDPAIRLLAGTTCATGTCQGSVSETISYASFGPTVTVETLGYSGGLTWNIISITPVSAACNPGASPLQLSIDPTQRNAQLFVSASLSFAACYQGFIGAC